MWSSARSGRKRVTLGVLVLLVPPAVAQVSEVPLELYTDTRWPAGVPFGSGLGVSFLDADHDGWPDLYVHETGSLWRNEEGETWSLAADLDVFLPPTITRYGSSCADYDNDGLPDIATEPYNGDCFYLLRNLGGGEFVEVASDPAQVLGQPCGMYAETACWADVDGDLDLDLFLPGYPDEVFAGAGGNRFWENLGASGPGGAYRLELSTPSAGLEIPAGVQRPEGAQFCDADRDGDVDLFSNHTLYQNRSRGRPSFAALLEGATGIPFANQLDEGVLFFDYDLDGDQDLIVLYSGARLRLWENRGDGTFFGATQEHIESPTIGNGTGLSAEDWDQDGDLDLISTAAFRRNMLVETGEPFLRLVTAEVLPWDRSVAWADWDRDGDPDCVFRDHGFQNMLYRNRTYGEDTPAERNLSLRVRPVREAPAPTTGGAPGGTADLETEFGATVELRVHDDASGRVRRRFVASSHGYLQQSEYALTMALPPGPDPAAPAEGVTFDLLVDFPGRPEQGLLRVDPGVNPVLGGIRLAELAEREITVFRSGRVVLDGQSFSPRSALSRRLFTLGDLALTSAEAPLPEPTPAPTGSWWIGIELATEASTRVQVEELVLDAHLAPPGPGAGAPFDLACWELGPGSAPRRIWEARLATAERNRRSFLPVHLVLAPAHRYRLVCRVDEFRTSAASPARARGALRALGALAFQDEDPASGAAVAAAEPLPGRTCLWPRYRTSALAKRP